jgi:hypothetical protein
MTEPKTKQTRASVEKFLNAVKDKKQREDSFKVLKMMEQVTKEKGKMWGPSIVGFGKYHYIYANGREGDWPIAAFSPRKGNLTLYMTPPFERYAVLMKKLGKYRTGVCCLYIKRLEDVDPKVLKELVKESVACVKNNNFGEGHTATKVV